MKKIILVATHKNIRRLQLDDCYKYIGVGVNYVEADYHDDIGDSVSKKNDYYCELTAMYWGWKNLDADVCGLCHYRRFFFKNIYAKNIQNEILSSQELERMLSKHKAILPSYYKKNKSSKYLHNLNDNKDWLVILYNCLKEMYPEYSSLFIAHTNLHYCVGGNMFIATKELYDSYCAWLFPLLNRFEHELIRNNRYFSRIIGYAGEYLTNVFFLYNLPERQIRRYDVINMYNQKWSPIKSLLYKLGIVQIKRKVVAFSVQKQLETLRKNEY